MLRRAARGYRGDTPISSGCHLGRGARRVVRDLGIDGVRPQPGFDLHQRLRMRSCDAYVFELRAGDRDETVTHRQDRFGGDAQLAMLPQQVIDVDDRSGERVLDGHDRGVDVAALERGEDFGKGADRNELGHGEQRIGALLGVRARRALVADSRRHWYTAARHSGCAASSPRAIAKYRSASMRATGPIRPEPTGRPSTITQGAT